MNSKTFQSEIEQRIFDRRHVIVTKVRGKIPDWRWVVSAQIANDANCYDFTSIKIIIAHKLDSLSIPINKEAVFLAGTFA